MIYQIIALSRELTASQIIAILMAYSLAVLIGITVHEFAHAFVAYKCGDDSIFVKSRITLNPAKHISGIGMIAFLFVGFGWANPVLINPMKFKNYKKSMALVSIAGILTNLIVAFVFSGIELLLTTYVLKYSNMFEVFVKYFLYYVVTINLALAIFNLLPIYPLDGFNFIKTFLKTNNKFVEFMYKYGSLVLLLVIISPIFDVFYSIVITLFDGFFHAFWSAIFFWYNKMVKKADF